MVERPCEIISLTREPLKIFTSLPTALSNLEIQRRKRSLFITLPYTINF